VQWGTACSRAREDKLNQGRNKRVGPGWYAIERVFLPRNDSLRASTKRRSCTRTAWPRQKVLEINVYSRGRLAYESQRAGKGALLLSTWSSHRSSGMLLRPLVKPLRVRILTPVRIPGATLFFIPTDVVVTQSRGSEIIIFCG